MKIVRETDGTPIIRADYSKIVLLTRDHFGHDGHLTQVVTIPPHIKQRHHVHRIQTEVMYVLAGECDVIVNKTNYRLSVGDSLIIEPGDIHAFENPGAEPCRIHVLKVHYPEDSEDTEWL